ncbi:MAG: hypothetical protein FWD40_10335 [Treponema sp.]|nr:hypothetical protein [Treponema sp.]
MKTFFASWNLRHLLLLGVRFLYLVVGLFFYALGIIITIKANIGYSPWDVFHVGIVNNTGLSLGIISILVGLVILVIVTLLKEKLGLGSIFNMVLIGLFIDIFFPHIPVMMNPVIGTIMLIAGLFIIALGSYFYIKSAFGAGPRDNLMVVLARKTKLPIGFCRCIIELLVTIIGWILGGMVGFGTVISVIAIGICVQIVFRLFRFDVTSVKHETLGDTYAEIKKVFLRKEV